MIRKLVKQGDSALTVTLPAKWIKQQELKPKDEVHIEESGELLVVSSTATNKRKTYELELAKELHQEAPYLIKRFLSALYKCEYDEIHIKLASTKPFLAIDNSVKELMGFEVVNQTSDIVKIKNISDGLEDNFDELYRKCINQVVQGGKFLLDYLETGDEEILSQILYLEKINNKFTDLLKRSLNRVGHYDTLATVFYYSVVRDAEKVVDTYRDAVNYIQKNELKSYTNALVLYFRLLVDLTKLFANLSFSFSYEDVLAFRDKKKELLQTYEQSMETIAPKERMILTEGYFAARDLFELVGSLFAIHVSPQKKVVKKRR